MNEQADTIEYDRQRICCEATYEIAELCALIVQSAPEDQPSLRGLALRIHHLNGVLMELLNPESPPTREMHDLVYAVFPT